MTPLILRISVSSVDILVALPVVDGAVNVFPFKVPSMNSMSASGSDRRTRKDDGFGVLSIPDTDAIFRHDADLFLRVAAAVAEAVGVQALATS